MTLKYSNLWRGEEIYFDIQQIERHFESECKVGLLVRLDVVYKLLEFAFVDVTCRHHRVIVAVIHILHFVWKLREQNIGNINEYLQ